MVLIDTCVLIWLSNDRSKLSPAATSALASSAGSTFISAISALEISIGYRKRRLTFTDDPETWFRRALTTFGVTPIAVSWEIASRSGSLPEIHADPFDRIIVESAAVQAASIITPDPAIAQYPGVAVIW